MSGGFKEQSLKSTEADNSTVLEIKQAGQKRAWQGRDLLELRWTKEMSDFGNRDRWHLYRDAVCATAGREVVLTKLDCSFSRTAPQEGLFKNVNNILSRGEPEMTLVCCSLKLVTSKIGT